MFLCDSRSLRASFVHDRCSFWSLWYKKVSSGQINVGKRVRMVGKRGDQDRQTPPYGGNGEIVRGSRGGKGRGGGR